MKYVYHSPIGYIYYVMKNKQLVSMYISDHEEDGTDELNDVINKALDDYFHGKLLTFDIPILFDHGTPFQKEVWQALLTIPYGKTNSYKEIAIKINRPRAVRAVGQACKKNPIGIIVPCHRVIGSDGSLTGYSGKNYINLKEKLLAHERRNI
ncbi:MAG: methylated-DNA--[protein]-cysteine S-methyltransferase [Acholeplasmataceae bacterium]|jgi:O-6-methylguanine DNA methyltransferase|nr:methylated-DNA--[protein]-cysteine S-methyltransferase [Acholeplasmataceae bacterium]